MLKSVKFMTLIGFSVCFVVIPCGFVSEVYLFSILLWLSCFFGGWIVPPTTGISIASVQKLYFYAKYLLINYYI